MQSFKCRVLILFCGRGFKINFLLLRQLIIFRFWSISMTSNGIKYYSKYSSRVLTRIKHGNNNTFLSEVIPGLLQFQLECQNFYLGKRYLHCAIEKKKDFFFSKKNLVFIWTVRGIPWAVGIPNLTLTTWDLWNM